MSSDEPPQCERCASDTVWAGMVSAPPSQFYRCSKCGHYTWVKGRPQPLAARCRLPPTRISRRHSSNNSSRSRRTTSRPPRRLSAGDQAGKQGRVSPGAYKPGSTHWNAALFGSTWSVLLTLTFASKNAYNARWLYSLKGNIHGRRYQPQPSFEPYRFSDRHGDHSRGFRHVPCYFRNANGFVSDIDPKSLPVDKLDLPPQQQQQQQPQPKSQAQHDADENEDASRIQSALRGVEEET